MTCCTMCRDDIEELTEAIDDLRKEMKELRDGLTEDVMELWKRVP